MPLTMRCPLAWLGLVAFAAMNFAAAEEALHNRRPVMVWDIEKPEGMTQAEYDFRMWGKDTCQKVQDDWGVCTKPDDHNHDAILRNCPYTCAKYGVKIVKHEKTAIGDMTDAELEAAGLTKDEQIAAKVRYECPVCRAVMREIESIIAKSDQKKTIQVGSFHIQPNGDFDAKKVSHARSEGHIEDIIEDMCEKTLKEYMPVDIKWPIYWRVANADTVFWRPRVKIRAYSDVKCSKNKRITIKYSHCSGHDGTDADTKKPGCKEAFEKNSNYWRPQCHECKPGEAWMTFTSSREAEEIRCIKAKNMGEGESDDGDWEGGLLVERSNVLVNVTIGRDGNYAVFDSPEEELIVHTPGSSSKLANNNQLKVLMGLPQDGTQGGAFENEQSGLGLECLRVVEGIEPDLIDHFHQGGHWKEAIDKFCPKFCNKKIKKKKKKNKKKKAKKAKKDTVKDEL